LTNQSNYNEENAVVIRIKSWATPVVGIVALLIGVIGGYAIRPYVAPEISSEGGAVSAQLTPTSELEETDVAESEVSAAESPLETEVSASSAEESSQQPSPEEMMAFLVEQTFHFKGDPEAPITIIEFSDFQ
jgi:hypothetical protein